MTLKEFITDHCQDWEMDASPIRHRAGWQGETDHWQVLLQAPNGKILTTLYSKGIGLRENRKGERPPFTRPKTIWEQEQRQAFKPKIYFEEVLESLQSDAHTLENSPLWPDFASDLGLNEDSIQDKTAFDTCVANTLALQAMLTDHYQTFLDCEVTE